MKRLLIPSILALGLILGSCNTDNRTKERTERSNENRTEIRERTETDSTLIKKDKTIRYDDEGNVIKEDVDIRREKDRK